MSEFRYYEFAAVDKSLSATQKAELRALSSRARITSKSFTNEYHWGALKGDPTEWMERYFDAHVFTENWSYYQFMLKIPKSALYSSRILDYIEAAPTEEGAGAAFSMTSYPEHWLLCWTLDTENCDVGHDPSEDDSVWMAELLPLRKEIISGDTRPLYLGWLAGLCACEFDDDAVEPPVPAGLRTLTDAQEALAEFLRIDADVLDAALAVSLDINATRLNESAPARRTVAQIEEARDALAAVRIERDQKAQQARAEDERLAHARHLHTVAARAESIWKTVETTLLHTDVNAYSRAVTALKELAEALRAEGRGDEFRRGIIALISPYGKRPALLSRLKDAGLI